MKQKLSGRDYTYVASMLFGMFFGAGNLIFPVHMGQMAGSNIWPAIIGFCVTGVGLPLLAACRLDGVLAMLRETLPLAKLGLFWVLPALLGLVIGLILHFVRSKANA